MLFVVIRHDKPDCVDLRAAARPGHLVYLERVIGCIKSGGAMLNPSVQQIGSMLVIDVADADAAQRFADEDPFVEAGLFAETVIRPFRSVFEDGAWL